MFCHLLMKCEKCPRFISFIALIFLVGVVTSHLFLGFSYVYYPANVDLQLHLTWAAVQYFQMDFIPFKALRFGEAILDFLTKPILFLKVNQWLFGCGLLLFPCAKIDTTGNEQKPTQIKSILSGENKVVFPQKSLPHKWLRRYLVELCFINTLDHFGSQDCF